MIHLLVKRLAHLDHLGFEGNTVVFDGGLFGGHGEHWNLPKSIEGSGAEGRSVHGLLVRELAIERSLVLYAINLTICLDVGKQKTSWPFSGNDDGTAYVRRSYGAGRESP